MSKQIRQSFLSGAFTLLCATVVVKIIGAVYKIPLLGVLGEDGTAYYSTAYAIYQPIYVLATAGMPAAVSRMVAEQYSRGRYVTVKKILKIALSFFLITGSIGAVIMFFVPDIVPASWNFFVAGDALPIKVLAPTLLLVCVMSAFRGYYEGLRNMYPTALSQMIEAVFKLVLGLVCATGAIKLGESAFAAGKPVFGTLCQTIEQAHAASLTVAAAGGILGVTVGAFFGLIYLSLRHRIKGDGITKEMLEQSPDVDDSGALTRRLFKIALPICVAAIALNLSGIIDKFTINSMLENMVVTSGDRLSAAYADYIAARGVGLESMPNKLWGLYNYGLAFFNLVPMLTATLGVSLLPTITQHWTRGENDLLHQNIERAIRVTALIAYPAAIGLAVMAEPVLSTFYLGRIGAEGVQIAARLLRILSITLLFGSFATPFGSILQGLGKPNYQLGIVVGGIAAKLATNFLLIRIPEFNITGAPVGTFMNYALVFFFELFFICSLSKIKLHFASTFFKPLLCALLCGGAAWLGYYLLHTLAHLSVLISTAAAIILAAVVYVVALLLLRAVSKADILSFKKGKKLAQILEKHHLIG